MGPFQDLREFINHHGKFAKEPSWVSYFLQLQVRKHRDACNVKWLRLRGEDVELIPEQALVPLKPKDLQIAKSLENYRAELTLMVESGQRAEIEALYSHGYDYLGKFIARKPKIIIVTRHL
ncbi:hypothetical protein ACFX1R_040041 [Malus domestica]|nr:meiotic recombination protein SPO11-2-like [Malus domestica]